MPVFSWDYSHLAPSRQWYFEAEAYVEASLRLLAEMESGDVPRKWPNGKVAAFLFAHGFELFLKAAIIHAGKTPGGTHDLRQLLNTFRNLYSGKIFSFTCSVDEVVDHDPTKPPFEYLKYPQDKHGNRWKGDAHIDITVWRDQVASFSEDIVRIWPEVLNRYPETAAV